MDENFGGRLAVAGINVLGIKDVMGCPTVFYEFRWRPKPGVAVWTKSFVSLPSNVRCDEDIVEYLIGVVRSSRTLAEAYDGE